MSNKQPIIEKALAATRESSEVEFKSDFDRTTRAWCELVKDIMAMANSNGGVIVFGLNNDGTHSGSDVSLILKIDPAQIIDQIHKYTNVDYGQFELRQETKNSKPVACLIIEQCAVPIIPTRPGEYETENKEKKCAFHKGGFYYRHGAKSEPGTTEDMARVIRKNVDACRRELSRDMQRVVRRVKKVVRPSTKSTACFATNSAAQPIRITENPEAPEYRITNPNKTYPFRMKELLMALNEEPNSLPNKATYFDIHALLELNNLNEDVRYTYMPTFGSRLYSQEFVAWIKERVLQDRYFLRNTRTRLRRKKRSTPALASSHSVCA